MTDSTMTEIPLWDRLEAGANSIAVDGTPSQVGPTAEELHQAAPMLTAAVEALEYISTETGNRGDGLIDWQRCVDRIQKRARNTLASLKQDGDDASHG